MSWSRRLETGRVFEAERLFPSEVLVLDAALCHSHSQYTLLSISIITAPRGLGRKKRERCTPFVACMCMCVCMNVAAFVPKEAKTKMCLRARLCVCVCIFCMWKSVCVCVCVWASQPSAVFSSSPTVIPLSAICPSLKHQLFSKGPLGEKETTGRLHVFFYPHKDVLLLPVLLFFQEVFAVRLFPFCRSEILFIHVPSLSFSLPLPLSLSLSLSFSVNWWCWLCFALPLSTETLSLSVSLCLSLRASSPLLPFLIPFEPTENIQICSSQILSARLPRLILGTLKAAGDWGRL